MYLPNEFMKCDIFYIKYVYISCGFKTVYLAQLLLILSKEIACVNWGGLYMPSAYMYVTVCSTWL